MHWQGLLQQSDLLRRPFILKAFLVSAALAIFVLTKLIYEISVHSAAGGIDLFIL
jgi:hypothetical protein